MIGKFLNAATTEMEDRLLTGRLVPHTLADGNGVGCLIGQAYGAAQGDGAWYTDLPRSVVEEIEFCVSSSLGTHFNQFVGRVGIQRAAELIRNRILSNRARRELAPVVRETLCGVSSTRGENL